MGWVGAWGGAGVGDAALSDGKNSMTYLNYSHFVTGVETANYLQRQRCLKAGYTKAAR